MTETSPQMRRSISMPVKPQHLEEETLKRSVEKETIFAATDEETSSDGDDHTDTTRNYIRQQRSTPALKTNDDNISKYKDNEISNTETESVSESTILNSQQQQQQQQRGHIAATKPFRSVRDFLNPLFTLFTRRNSTTPTWTSVSTVEPQIDIKENSTNSKCDNDSNNLNFTMENQIITKDNILKDNDQQTEGNSSRNGHEKVTFSLN